MQFSVQLTFPIFFKCSKGLQRRIFKPKIKWKDSFDMKLVDDTSNFKIALLSCFSSVAFIFWYDSRNSLVTKYILRNFCRNRNIKILNFFWLRSNLFMIYATTCHYSLDWIRRWFLAPPCSFNDIQATPYGCFLKTKTS